MSLAARADFGDVRGKSERAITVGPDEARDTERREDTSLGPLRIHYGESTKPRAIVGEHEHVGDASGAKADRGEMLLASRVTVLKEVLY